MHIPCNPKFSNKKKYILILGNGLSRLHPSIKRFIHNWQYEIWVCNGAWREALALPNITRINGHKECLIAAHHFKIKHNLSYDCYVQSPIKKGYAGDEYYGIPLKQMSTLGGLKTDSGTGWVICAFKEGYEKIYLAGFDLKGKEIYNDGAGPEMNYRKPKPVWVKKWFIISEVFGFDKITFLGRHVIDIIKEDE